jgi:hypothetical protein
MVLAWSCYRCLNRRWKVCWGFKRSKGARGVGELVSEGNCFVCYFDVLVKK